MLRVHDLVEMVVRRRRSLRRAGPLLVALSGIDASGKSTLARMMEESLAARGFRVALVGADPWHQPAALRFGGSDPAGRFYRNAFRFEELFRRLIDPLRRDGSITLTANLLKLAPESRYPHTYRFQQIDIILLEGIFLLRQDLRERYDLSFWIDCSFETALGRALERNQEGLPKSRLIADYEAIYFPAQRMHLAADWPRFFADAILPNEEPRGAAVTQNRLAHAPSPWRTGDAHEQSL